MGKKGEAGTGKIQLSFYGMIRQLLDLASYRFGEQVRCKE